MKWLVLYAPVACARPSFHRTQGRGRRTLAAMLACALAACTAPTVHRESTASPDAATATGRNHVRFRADLPAVVLQAGLQDGQETWSRVLPDLLRHRTAIAIDRPGRAGSPATDAPRDPCTIAADQRRVLLSANIPPPYILVGHSLGGLYQYVYAHMYPDDVAGLVLLDPTHPRHWETMQREAPSAALLLKSLRAIAFDATDQREFDSQATCLDRLDLKRPLPIPVELLVSGRFKPAELGAYARMRERLREDWIATTGASDDVRITDSGHYIQRDRPDAIVEAVERVDRRAATPGWRQGKPARLIDTPLQSRASPEVQRASIWR